MVRILESLLRVQRSSPKLVQEISVKDQLLAVAAMLDRGDLVACRTALTAIDPSRPLRVERKVAVAIWLKLLNAEAELYGRRDEALLRWCRSFNAGLEQIEIWPVLKSAKDAGAAGGAADVSRIFQVGAWESIALGDGAVKNEALGLSFAGGRASDYIWLFMACLSADTAFVPTFWHYSTLVRQWSTEHDPESLALRTPLLYRPGRGDLVPLLNFYDALVAQRGVASALLEARQLVMPEHRLLAAEYLIAAPRCPGEMALVADTVDHLLPEGYELDRAHVGLRRAVDESRWQDAQAHSVLSLDHGALRNQAVALHGLALAFSGDFDNATAAANHLRYGSHAPWYVRAAGANVAMAARLLEQKGALPPHADPADHMPLGTGVPLAQSLWVGRRLRWIEEMSIRSFLINGWRYKLFVYDVPENVPEGVEVCDATSILPRSAIFREGAGSGGHIGSLGAFSDLFRYALLDKLGGMWTDTDVINLCTFDPEGRKFVSTEWTDAGMLGPNGAMMAAPAGDPLIAEAFADAKRLVAAGHIHFGRVGPQLLAEHLADGGSRGFTIYPPDFLNPFCFMEAGRLLDPFDEIVETGRLGRATNIHVYTETWRVMGLSLSRPPEGPSFLSQLYERIMAETTPSHSIVKSWISA